MNAHRKPSHRASTAPLRIRSLHRAGPVRAAGDPAERYRRLIETIADAIFLHGPDGRIVEVNPAASGLSGYSRDELLGMRVEDLEVSLPLPEMREAWQRVVAGETVLADGTHRRKDGRLVPVEIRFGLLEACGEPLIVASVRDLTERRRAEAERIAHEVELEKVREVRRLSDRLLSNFSHQMKTPLAVIQGNAELLEDSCPDKPLIDGLKEGVRRLTRQINHLIDYGAILSDNLPLFPTAIDPVEFVERLPEIARGRDDVGDRRLEVAIDPACPPIWGDWHRITQMMRELFDNAVKATGPDETIRVLARPAGSEVELRMCDDGEGIPEDEQAGLWYAFGPPRSDDTKHIGGLGLGLPLVKRLAELHGGRVAVESAPGRGACFSIFLPKAPAAARAG